MEDPRHAAHQERGTDPTVPLTPGPEALASPRTGVGRAQWSRVPILCLLVAVSLGHGCMAWRPQWPDLARPPAPADASARLGEADRLGREAVSRNDIEATVAAQQRALEVDSASYSVCVTLSHLHLLLGTAYASNPAEAIDHFQKARMYAEWAMFTSPSFRQEIGRGEPTWEACRVLGKEEMAAMFFWVNSVFYEYKDGQGFLGQMINFRWVRRAKQVLEHLTSIEPDWAGGALHFTWGIYYLSIPESVGGDRKKSAELFARAIEVGPDWLVNRWGRAKYFHVKMKNPRGFREDLQWVVSQDPSRSPGHRAWNAYFWSDARQMLASVDRYSGSE